MLLLYVGSLVLRVCRARMQSCTLTVCVCVDVRQFLVQRLTMKFSSTPTGPNPKKARGTQRHVEKRSGNQSSILKFLGHLPCLSPGPTLEQWRESNAHACDGNGSDDNGSGVADSQVASCPEISKIWED